MSHKKTQIPAKATMHVNPDTYKHEYAHMPVLPVNLEDLPTDYVFNEHLYPLVETFTDLYNQFHALPSDDLAHANHKNVLIDLTFRLKADVERILEHYMVEMSGYDSLALSLGFNKPQPSDDA